MALSPVRYEYRLALSDVDRRLDVETTVLTARHPSETAAHLTLRVLAYCLLYRDDLAFGPGLSDGEGADLEVRDGGGRVLLWAECGAVEASKLRRVVQQNHEAAVHVVLGDERRRQELDAGLAALPHGIRGGERVTRWQIGAALVAALAGNESRRQRWAVTLVDGHLYVDADGAAIDGEVGHGTLGGASGRQRGG